MPDVRTKKITALAERQFSHLFDDIAAMIEDENLRAHEAGYLLRMAATNLRLNAAKLDPEGIDEAAS